jgi:F0F1-type ATP synthase epsilon subunit
MKESETPGKLKVIARGPFNLYYDGEAEAVTATNKVGKFDILPEHADFFSILSPGEIIIETAKDPIAFNVSNGIVTVRDNEVMIFVNI